MLHVDVESADALKEAMRDNSITAKAKAMLAYFVIMGDGHKITASELRESMNEGERATREALRSLENGGYLQREYTSELGTFTWHWYVSIPKENAK